MKKPNNIFSIVVIMIIFSCNPLRHYQKVKDDSSRDKKELTLLAETCIQAFPSKPDTVINFSTDTVYSDANYVELNSIIDSLIIANNKLEKDTAYIKQLEQRLSEVMKESCPPSKIITQTKTVTITKPDSAKEFLLAQQVTFKDGEINKLNNENSLLKDIIKINEKNRKTKPLYNLKWLAKSLLTKWWFWVLIISFAGYIFKSPLKFILKRFL